MRSAQSFENPNPVLRSLARLSDAAWGRVFGVSRQSVGQWRKFASIPRHYMRAFAALTGVSVEQQLECEEFGKVIYFDQFIKVVHSRYNTESSNAKPNVLQPHCMELTKAQTAILQRYAKRKISRGEAAKALGGISERHVNRLSKGVDLDRVESPSHKKRSEAAKRRIAREQGARLVKRGDITIKQAAMRAGCSERTIFRYLAKVRS